MRIFQESDKCLEDLAVMFEKVAAIERSHEKCFMTLLAKVGKSNETFSTAPEVTTPPIPQQKRYGYRCQFCGAIFQECPDVCDTCGAIDCPFKR